MKLRLISQDPLASPREIVLEHFPADIGRGTDVALRIDDRWISRRHCRLTLEGSDIYVRDLSSRHGTYVNGQAIDYVRLQPGNELCLGLSHFLVAHGDNASDSNQLLVAAGHDSDEFEAPVYGKGLRSLVFA